LIVPKGSKSRFATAHGVMAACGLSTGAADRRRFYHVFVVVVVIRYKTTATARWALLFIIRASFNDTIAVAVWAGFHVRLMGKLTTPIWWQFYSVVFRCCNFSRESHCDGQMRVSSVSTRGPF
jgi:hypothetical protein